LGPLEKDVGVTEEIKYNSNGYKTEVFGALTCVPGYHHDEVIEQEEKKQLDGEPVPAGRNMPKWIEGVMVVDTEQEAEHHRGDDELHELPLKQFSDGFSCPLNVFLICHESANEEEKYQIEVHKNMMERMGAVHMIPVPTDMGIYHKVHAEASQGIDVFYSFTICNCSLHICNKNIIVTQFVNKPATFLTTS